MGLKRTHRVGSWVAAIAVVGTVVSPVVASAQTANTTINATIAAVISVSTSGTVNLSLTPTSGGVVSSGFDTITVNTNDTAGYTLNVADSDANTNLVSGGNNIAASSNTTASPATLANNTWGFALPGTPFDATYTAETNQGSSVSKWAGMPATGSPFQLKSTSTTASGDTTTVWYGVKANSTQASGSYTDTVTYTATAK